MTFGNRIRELRQAKNLTLRDVAKRVKVTFTYLSKIENQKLSFGEFPSFANRTEYVPDDLRSLAETTRQNREADSVDALIRLCRTLCQICTDPYAQIRRELGQGKNLDAQMDDLVNQERMVKLWIKWAHGRSDAPDVYIKGAEEGLSPDWFAYHHARSSLALWCVFMLKYGEKDEPGKEFRNTKLDADYAALLHYADALATNETSGSMTDICSWLYRGSKKRFSTQGVDSVLPSEDKIRLDAYFTWDRGRRKHGHDLDDWLSAERALMEQVWDRLGIENDSSSTAICRSFSSQGSSRVSS